MKTKLFFLVLISFFILNTLIAQVSSEKNIPELTSVKQENDLQNLQIPQSTLYTYNYGWTPNAPTDPNNPSTSIDDIEVNQGFPTIESGTVLEVRNISITNEYAGFISTGEIRLYGDIENHGVFNSINKIQLVGSSSQVFSGTSSLLLNDLELGTASEGVVPLELNLNSPSLNINGNLANSRLVRIRGTLTPNGRTINFNDQLIFDSRASGNGILTGIIGNSQNATLNGEVVVERFIPAKRAYRLLSAPLGTGTLKENWMEGVNNATTQNNLNPYPGFGTHMSGEAGSFNDWDETQTNNPSVFEVNAQAMPAAFEALPNSNESFEYGKGYLVYVRGSRSTNLNNNAASPNETILRAKGQLLKGSLTLGNTSLNTGDFNAGGNGSSLIGNPYQAPVDMQAVLSTAQDINPNFYHIYDPTIGELGAYVTVAFGSPDVNSFTYVQNGVLVSESSANRYLQPGQAAFVNTVNSGGTDGTANPQLTFTEDSKYLQSTNSGVFRASEQIPASLTGNLSVQLYQEAEFAEGEKPRDAVLLRFNNEFSSTIDGLDASKSINLGENLATEINGSLLSIDSRAIPTQEEELQLSLENLSDSNYIFKINLNGLEEVNAYLIDNYLQTSTQINPNEETLINFSIDAGNNLSTNKHRFKIVFEESSLKTQHVISNNFTVFPNPSNGLFDIQFPATIQGKTQLMMYNILGEHIFNNTYHLIGKDKITINKTNLPSGVYVLQIINGTNTKTQRLVIK